MKVAKRKIKVPAEPFDALKARAKKIVSRLAKLYPDAHCELNFRSPWELLVATVLSAQCTDKRVNLVTPTLFSRFPNPQAFADAETDLIEEMIHSTGFFRNKAKSIKRAAETVMQKHQGNVPQTLEELIELGGVGRKTANVILGSAFGITGGVVVDTHVTRLSLRLGFTKETDARKIEKDLMEIIPKKSWILFSHYLILHGRRVCVARKPKCQDCIMNDLCPSAFNV